MAVIIEAPRPAKADVGLFKPVPRPEWRIPPPPFRGPHTEEAKTKNRISNTGQKRDPDFGPKISTAMVDVWKRDEYREKRKGIKRNHSPKTRARITKSLERKWKNDEQYRDKMLETRRSVDSRIRSKKNLERTWKENRSTMLKHARKASKRERTKYDGFSERAYWHDFWMGFKIKAPDFFNYVEVKLLDNYFEGRRNKTKSIKALLDRLSVIAAKTA